MTNEEQIIELLREIRDLQKSHFERYREYSEKLLQAGQEQEQERRLREEAARAELRRATWGIWTILALALLIFLFLRPVGDWLLTLFDR